MLTVEKEHLRVPFFSPLWACQPTDENRVEERTNHIEETALDGAFRIVSVKLKSKSDDFIRVIEEEYEHIEEILRNRMRPAIKFYLSLKLNLSKLIDEDEEKTAVFNTSSTLLLPGFDITSLIKDHVEILEVKVDNYMQNGSGWVINSVNQINVMITTYDPINQL